MVLSGFCIHLSGLRGASARREPGGGERDRWNDYLRRRLVRILPVYWAGAALGLLFVALQTVWPAPHRTLEFYAQGTPADAAMRLLGLSTLYPREIIVGNSILNYVSCELAIYFLYPLLFTWMHSRRWPLLIGVGAVGQALGYLLAKTIDPFWAYNTPLMLGLFWLLGARLAQHIAAGNAPPGPSLLLASLAAFYLVLEACPPFPGRNLLLQLLWAGVSLFLISLAISLERKRPALGVHPLTRRLRRLGKASYSLYVVHSPALFISGWILLHLIPAPTYALQLAAGLALTVTFTLFSFVLVENPCLRRLSRGNPVEGGVAR